MVNLKSLQKRIKRAEKKAGLLDKITGKDQIVRVSPGVLSQIKELQRADQRRKNHKLTRPEMNKKIRKFTKTQGFEKIRIENGGVSSAIKEGKKYDGESLQAYFRERDIARKNSI